MRILNQQSVFLIKVATKLSLVMLLIFSAPGIAQAQWTTSGNDIYSSNSGNVGIGTSSPANKLVVDLGSFSSTEVRALDVNANASACCTRFQLLNNGSVVGFLQFNAGSPNLFLSTNAAYNLNLGVNNGVKLTVNGSSGYIGIGTTAPSSELHVVGDVTVTGNISAKYQDLAEWVPASREIAAGTVVTLDPDGKNTVIPSTKSYDTRVAGVVSATPGIVLGEAGEDRVKVATTGRVKVHVDASRAPIRTGDLLVTSDREGFAMKSEPVEIGGRKIHQPGTLIGKALEPLLDGEGEILVLLSLQ